ncbi:hypothetical protein ADEAN_000530400 [Angomonas deanei]|uniref:Uncharacterized protein n=1 Tax=Angomonas deanei TaxID=59799 RepID=A0A7G2CFT3_9TRYP|nr:hypothetical protein ADEAN_000530400 [Angomonas deanei]
MTSAGGSVDAILAQYRESVRAAGRQARQTRHREKWPLLQPPIQIVTSVRSGRRALRLPLKEKTSYRAQKEARKKMKKNRPSTTRTDKTGKQPEPKAQMSLASLARMERFSNPQAPKSSAKGVGVAAAKGRVPVTKPPAGRSLWIRKCNKRSVKANLPTNRTRGLERQWAVQPSLLFKHLTEKRIPRRCLPWRRRRLFVKRRIAALSSRGILVGGKSYMTPCMRQVSIQFWDTVKVILMERRSALGNLQTSLHGALPTVLSARSFPLFGSVCEMVHIHTEHDGRLNSFSVVSVCRVIPLTERDDGFTVVVLDSPLVEDYLRDCSAEPSVPLTSVKPIVTHVKSYFPGGSGGEADLTKLLSHRVLPSYITGLRYRGELVSSDGGVLQSLVNRYL